MGFFNHRVEIDWQRLSSTTTEMEWVLIQAQWVGLPCWMLLYVFSTKCHLHLPTIWNLLWLSTSYKRSKISVVAAIYSIMTFFSFPQNVPFSCFVHRILRKVGLLKWKFCKILLLYKLVKIWVECAPRRGALIVSLPFQQTTSAYNMFLRHLISLWFFTEK